MPSYNSSAISDPANQTYRGRIAPTPSGFLHTGHAKTFKTAWIRARKANGKIVLRIEDIDSERTRPEYVSQVISDLKKIGLDWDEGPDIGGSFGPYVQSLKKDYYWSVLQTLREKNLVYPCTASRTKIKALSLKPARQMDFCEAEAIFPPCLRPKGTISAEDERHTNWRFKTPDGKNICFKDEIMGQQCFTAGEDFGDFLVWRKTDEPSYELAVVADDIAMKITEVVRGQDLLLSTARQLLVYEALDARPPLFVHCPLVADENGIKLSKSVLAGDAENKFLIKNMPSAQ